MKISSLKGTWVNIFPVERNLTSTIDNKLNLWKKERKTVRMFSKAWKHFISTFWKLLGFKTIFHEKLFWASLKLPQNRTLNETEKIIPDLWISQAFTWVKKDSRQLHKSIKGTVQFHNKYFSKPHWCFPRTLCHVSWHFTGHGMVPWKSSRTRTLFCLFCHQAHFLQNILRFTCAAPNCGSESNLYSCFRQNTRPCNFVHNPNFTFVLMVFWELKPDFPFYLLAQNNDIVLSTGICSLPLGFCSIMGVKAGKSYAQWTWELTGSQGEDHAMLHILLHKSTYPLKRYCKTEADS